MKKWQLALLLGATGIYLSIKLGVLPSGSDIFNNPNTPSDEAMIERAFKNRQSDLQVGGSGLVLKVLPDDNEGSRHQRFILRLASGQTLLVAHNIDIGRRLDPLSEGERVYFYGEYEWNEKGGIVHWTHQDPTGRHIEGWVRKTP